ncbi:MAG: RsmE family RNA methyltransferase [Candidatus Dependentiae bacterium]
MTATKDARHHFCVYVGDSALHDTDSFHSRDADLAHRLHRVLRLRAGSSVQLFNDTHHALLRLGETKKWKTEVVGSISNTAATIARTPALHVGIGLLKPAALEQAIYAASAAGATSITPIITSKSQKELSDRERERLRMQVIAACEQAKNVQLPQLHVPLTLEKFLDSEPHTRCWFDGSGAPLPMLVQDLASLPPSISLLIGAEAGFTSAEEALIRSHDWPAYCLTPTVLRAVEAVTVAVSVVSGTVF